LAGDLHRSGGDIKATYGVPVEDIVKGTKRGVRKARHRPAFGFDWCDASFDGYQS
jgi:hypothetical protein